MRSLSSLPFVLLLLCLGLLYLLEIKAAEKFPPVPFSAHLQNRLKAEAPDAIFVGNSTLGVNVNQSILEAELSRLSNRPVRVSFISKGGIHTACYYLILKNQIAAAARKGTPVIFIDNEDNFIKPEERTATAGATERFIQANMQEDEAVFLSKLGASGLYFSRGFPYLFSQRYRIKRWLVAGWSNLVLSWTGLDDGIQHRKFQTRDAVAINWLLGTVFSSRKFRAGDTINPSAALDPRRLDTLREFESKAEQSFMPELLAYARDFELYFVLSNTNPAYAMHKDYVRAFTAQFKHYLQDKAVAFIDLDKHPALQEPGLMNDSRHFIKGAPVELNTQVLAAELYEAGLFRGPTQEP